MPSRRRRLLALVPTFVLVVLFNGTSLGGKSIAVLRRRLLEEHTVQQKPVIYTFYHGFNGAVGSGTGMTAEADEVLLKIWKGEWSTAGWIPRVLTLEDARQHPHFGTLDNMLNGLPFKMYDVSVVGFNQWDCDLYRHI
jgi:hypothetical protein